jgi:hypothetical protein
LPSVPDDNRRTSTRHPVSIAANVKVDWVVEECTILNLSLGGALVAMSRKLVMGTRIGITFSVPTVEQTIDVGATVRWCDALGVGVQFDGLRAIDVWALNRYFEKLPA